MSVRKTCMCGLVAACAMALPAIAAAQLPNSFKTPGAADKVDTKKLCAANFDSTVKPMADWQKNDALTRYGVRPESFDGVLEHVVPVSLGGTNDPDNLYPFHPQGEFTADAKAQLATKLHDMVCDGKITLKQAQEVFKKDWTKGYKQYVQALNAPGGE